MAGRKQLFGNLNPLGPLTGTAGPQEPPKMLDVGVNKKRQEAMLALHSDLVKRGVKHPNEGPGYVVQNVAQVLNANQQRADKRADQAALADSFEKQGFGRAVAEQMAVDKISRQYHLQSKMADAKAKTAHERAIEILREEHRLKMQEPKDVAKAMAARPQFILSDKDGNETVAEGTKHEDGSFMVADPRLRAQVEAGELDYRIMSKAETKVWEEAQILELKEKKKAEAEYNDAKKSMDDVEGAIAEFLEFTHANPDWQKYTRWAADRTDISPGAKQFRKVLASIKASGFMSVYKMLKGAGAITENETRQAQPMIDTIDEGTDPAAIFKAINYMHGALQLGIVRAGAKAGKPGYAEKLAQMRQARRDRITALLQGTAQPIDTRDPTNAAVDAMRPDDEVDKEGYSIDPRDAERNQKLRDIAAGKTKSGAPAAQPQVAPVAVPKDNATRVQGLMEQRRRELAEEARRKAAHAKRSGYGRGSDRMY